MGQVIAIHISAEVSAPMRSLERANILTDFGLEGDRKARPGSKRQVLIISAEILEEFGLQPGDVRENLTTRGIDIMALERGQRVRIGPVLLETTVPCTPCDFMDSLRPGLQEESRGRRGMLFRVLEGGQVRVGDPVIVLD
ncbi:MAG TPA: MOSC domain-containing protein [Chloroflexi bacterium]|nr:MOSC domain-containing protein [Chloroflexota bacterium]